MLGRNSKKNIVRMSSSDYVVLGILYVVLFMVLLIVTVPLLNVIASSFSSPSAVSAGKVTVFPIGFTLEGYKLVFGNDKLVTGYMNTIFYTVVGTVINLIITIMAAYPLSRKDFAGGGFLMKLYTFTMYFGGGMIPTYLLVKNVGILNTRWAMLLPSALSVYNMIVLRTNFQSNIPNELLESAKIDGCSDFRFLVQFVVPLSKAIIAVLVLWYGVAHWNTYFDAYLYLTDEGKYPLSVFIQMMLGGVISSAESVDAAAESSRETYTDLLKYSLIMVSCVPVWCIYPFVQKFFVQGVMIGSIKG